MDQPRYLLRFALLSLLFSALLFSTKVLAKAADLRTAPAEDQLIETLRSGKPAAKAIACKQLAVRGSKAAVPELAKLLADEQLSSWARIALEVIPDPAADAALIDAAKSLDGKLLVGTINSIGVRRSNGATDVLIGKLTNGDAAVACASAVALGRIGNEKATEALGRALAGDVPAVRSAAAEGCVLCAEKLLADGKGESAAKIYEQVRKAEVPEQRKLEATRGVILARGAAAMPLLVEQLKSPNKRSFALGLTIAREVSSKPDVVKALSEALASSPPERAALMVIALGECSQANLPPAVLQAVRKGDKRVRLAALQVIGKRGDESMVPALLEAAVDSDDELSQAAKSALTTLPGPKVNAAIASRLASANGKPLVVLIEQVGERRIDASKDLVKSLANSDSAIRSAALAALGATVTPKDLKVLISVVAGAKDDADRKAAARALHEASVRMPDRDATAAELATEIPKASLAAKITLLEILGEVGGPNAIKVMDWAVGQETPELQDAATRALGQWMTADAAPVLLKVAKNKSPENKYQTRALRGYLRIVRQLNLPDNQRIEMCRTALKIADRPEERKLALEALKKCPSAESVQLASSLLDDEQTRDSAVEVAVYIGEKIKDKDPAAAKSAGEKALKAAPDGKLAERARALAKSPN